MTSNEHRLTWLSLGPRRRCPGQRDPNDQLAVGRTIATAFKDVGNGRRRRRDTRLTKSRSERSPRASSASTAVAGAKDSFFAFGAKAFAVVFGAASSAASKPHPPNGSSSSAESSTALAATCFVFAFGLHGHPTRGQETPINMQGGGCVGLAQLSSTSARP